jgi:hypothetical protein
LAESHYDSRSRAAFDEAVAIGTAVAVAEMWFSPDASRIIELSTKCARDEAFQVLGEARAFLKQHGVDLTGEGQDPQGAGVLLSAPSRQAEAIRSFLARCIPTRYNA